MIADQNDWFPGSFTKNFSWGRGVGLKRLHDAINICFDYQLTPVPRAKAVERLERDGFVWHIPLNFFMLNSVVEGENTLIVDELIYQAITFDHSDHFDKVALVAFLNSYVGHWQGAHDWQARPAPWARQFLLEEIRHEQSWRSSYISADHIEKFILNSKRYRAESARKLSTNLNYLFQIAQIHDLASDKVQRWWVDAMFLVLDRSFAETEASLTATSASQMIYESDYLRFSGPRSKNRELAVRPLSDLYWACGGLDRWSPDAIREWQTALIPDVHYFANSDDPFFAIYQNDPNVIKVIPRVCAMLAKNLTDFEEISAEELVDWNPFSYIQNKTRLAFDRLKEKGISPRLSAIELLKMTRGE